MTFTVLQYIMMDVTMTASSLLFLFGLATLRSMMASGTWRVPKVNLFICEHSSFDIDRFKRSSYLKKLVIHQVTISMPAGRDTWLLTSLLIHKAIGWILIVSALECGHAFLVVQSFQLPTVHPCRHL